MLTRKKKIMLEINNIDGETFEKIIKILNRLEEIKGVYQTGGSISTGGATNTGGIIRKRYYVENPNEKTNVENQQFAGY